MKYKGTPASQCDPTTAFKAADAFLRNTSLYFAEVPNELEAASQFAHSSFGALIVATTNLALAAELFLKCQAMVLRLPVVHTHDLLALYDALPADVRADIDRGYAVREAAIPKEGRTVALEVAITRTPKPPSKDALAKAEARRTKVTDVRSLLSAEKNAFVNWRYFFQNSPDGEVSLFRAEYVRLKLLVDVIRERILKNSTHGKA